MKLKTTKIHLSTPGAFDVRIQWRMGMLHIEKTYAGFTSIYSATRFSEMKHEALLRFFVYFPYMGTLGSHASESNKYFLKSDK